MVSNVFIFLLTDYRKIFMVIFFAATNLQGLPPKSLAKIIFVLLIYNTCLLRIGSKKFLHS
ncbi:MAG: hypothetical protein CMF71_09355 [Magnetovibrio sp.]|nr:hypothetical protein [Magnetovibrio sp.]